MSYRPDRPPGSETWTTVDEWADWLTGTGVIRSVRAGDSPVCSRCRRPLAPDKDGRLWDRCWACKKVYDSLTRAVVPMSYSSSSGLTSLIAQAKDDPARPWVRFGLACTLYQFLQQHRACLETWAGGAFDHATVVPSHHSRRGGWDHLKAMIRCVAGATWPGYQWDLDLLTKTTESVADDRRQRVHPGLFTADSSVNLAGRRVLLVDDLYTSGSTSASAAHCLVSRGADPPIIVTIGRHLDTGTREVKRFVDEQQLSDRAYEPDDCAVHQRPSLFSRVPLRPHPWTDWS